MGLDEETPVAWRRVMRAEDLWGGEMIGVCVDGRPVLLVNLEGVVRAYEDRCAHLAMPLSRGKLSGNVLVCGSHAWEYDACTGRGVNPAGIALRCYGVRIDDGNILVSLRGNNHDG